MGRLQLRPRSSPRGRRLPRYGAPHVWRPLAALHGRRPQYGGRPSVRRCGRAPHGPRAEPARAPVRGGERLISKAFAGCEPGGLSVAVSSIEVGGRDEGGRKRVVFRTGLPVGHGKRIREVYVPLVAQPSMFSLSLSLSLSLSMNSWCAPVLAFIGSRDFQSVVEYSYWRPRVCLHVQSCQSYFFAFQLFRNCSCFLTLFVFSELWALWF